MWLVNGCLYVLWRQGLNWNTLCDLQETHSQECWRGRVRRQCVRSQVLLITLNTENQFQTWCFPLFELLLNCMQIWSSICTNNEQERNIDSFPCQREAGPPCPVWCKGWACPRGPSAPWALFWLLRYNEGAVARLLRGKSGSTPVLTPS